MRNLLTAAKNYYILDLSIENKDDFMKKEKRVLNGALIGLLYFVFLSVVSFIINKGLYDDVKKAIISFVICITGGILGAIMS